MFRFTIRDVLWLTLVVALATAWWSQKANLEKDAVIWRHRATAAKGILLERGWEVSWDRDTAEFQNGDQLITCPPPKPGENYVWYNGRLNSN